MEETVALTDWRMEMGMLRLLEKQYEALQEARIEKRYLQTLLDAVAAFAIVRSSSVPFDKRTLDAGLIRGELTFADGSCLHFRELVEIQARVIRIMYSYHCRARRRLTDLSLRRYAALPGFASVPSP